jgi:cell division protein FtsA
MPTATAGSRAQPHVRLAEGGFAGVIADPKYATGLGLVLYGAGHEPVRHHEAPRRVKDEGPGIARRFGAWVREMF